MNYINLKLSLILPLIDESRLSEIFVFHREFHEEDFLLRQPDLMIIASI